MGNFFVFVEAEMKGETYSLLPQAEMPQNTFFTLKGGFNKKSELFLKQTLRKIMKKKEEIVQCNRRFPVTRVNFRLSKLFTRGPNF